MTAVIAVPLARIMVLILLLGVAVAAMAAARRWCIHIIVSCCCRIRSVGGHDRRRRPTCKITWVDIADTIRAIRAIVGGMPFPALHQRAALETGKTATDKSP
jgi:hypothetical protein